MAFPQTPLRQTVETALGADLTASPSTWSWTDVTALVRSASVSITRGRANEFVTAPTARAPMTMNNDDGRWVEDNPTGIWYGLIGLNTPVRILVAPDINTAGDTYTRTVSNGWGTATVGGAWTVVGTASEYSTTGSAARLTLASAATRRYATLSATYATFDMTCRIRTAALSTGAAQSAGFLFHFAASTDTNRYEVIFNTDQSISCRAVARVASVETFGPTVVSGLTHVANTWYRVRAQSTSTNGQLVRIKIWLDGTAEPTTWTTHNNISTALNLAAGAIGLTGTRETGNTNASAVIEFDDFTYVDGPVPRHTGYIEGLPRRWGDHSTTILNAPINPLGLSGRLQQGGVLQSALRRATLTATGLTPRAYWPCEDKSTATQIAPGIPGGLPARVTQPMSLGQGVAAGSDPLVVANTGRVTGQVVPYTGTDWTVMILLDIPAAPSAAQDLLIWTTSGSYVNWQLVLTPQAGPTDLLSLQAYDSSGVEHIGDVGTNIGKPYAQQLWLEVSAQQVGADINWSYFLWNVGGKIGTRTGATAGTITSVTFAAPLMQNTVFGHISVWDNATASLGALGYIGFAGESATTRFTRVAAQESIPVTLVATPTYDVAAMGAPTSGTLLSQFREVESTDQGILYDEVDGTITYLPRESRFNRSVAMTLDVALGQVAWPTEPDNDNQILVNDATSTQPNGTSYRYFDTTSSRSVTRIGYYSKPFPTNLYIPQDLRQDAEFRVALGTVPESRWTTLTVSLTGHPELIAAWLQCNIGSRIQIINTAILFTPDPVDLILEGYQEDISSTDWKLTLYTSSAKPWNAWIAESGGGNSSRPDSGTSSIAVGVTSSAGQIAVTTTDTGDLWTTSGGDYPFDVGAAGERMTATAAGLFLSDTFTRTTSSSWGTADTGQAWTTSGGSASDYSTNGTQGVHNLSTTVTQRLSSLALGIGWPLEVYADWVHIPSAPTGSGAVTLSLIACKPDANNYVALQLFATVGGTVTVAVEQVTGGSVVAQDTTFPSVGSLTTTYSARLHITNTLIQGRVWVRGSTEPTTWTTSVATTSTPLAGDVAWRTERAAGVTNAAPYFIELDGLTLPLTQLFSVTRHVNGVTKAQTALDPLGVPTRFGLWNPSVLAL